MKTKKFVSLCLALIMCLAMAVPAFATSEETKFDAEGSNILPTLKMTYPSSAQIILNPYKMAYTGTNTGTGLAANADDQILNAVFSVVSETNASVKVKMALSGKTSGNASFSSSTVATGDTGNKVFLQLTYKTATGADAAVPTGGTAVTISDAEQTKEVTLPAGNTTKQRIDMQFSGTCSDTPDTPWTDRDYVSCGFVFTVVAVANAGGGAGGGGTTPSNPTATATYNAASAANITFTTTAPSPVGGTPAYTVTSVTGLTGVTASNCTWSGTTVTIPTSELSSAAELDTDGDVPVTVGLSYSDGSTTQTLTYDVTLTVSGNS